MFNPHHPHYLLKLLLPPATPTSSNYPTSWNSFYLLQIPPTATPLPPATPTSCKSNLMQLLPPATTLPPANSHTSCNSLPPATPLPPVNPTSCNCYLLQLLYLLQLPCLLQLPYVLLILLSTTPPSSCNSSYLRQYILHPTTHPTTHPTSGNTSYILPLILHPTTHPTSGNTSYILQLIPQLILPQAIHPTSGNTSYILPLILHPTTHPTPYNSSYPPATPTSCSNVCPTQLPCICSSWPNNVPRWVLKQGMCIARYYWHMDSCSNCSLPESDGKWHGVDKCINLKHTDKEETEMSKHLCEEVPEHTHVWSQVSHRQTEIHGNIFSTSQLITD